MDEVLNEVEKWIEEVKYIISKTNSAQWHARMKILEKFKEWWKCQKSS